jgi:DNA invertase Pin-like site-specific DNA recombinase
MTAVAYIRVSSHNAAHHADEVATQLHTITRYLGHAPDETFIDVACAGTKLPTVRSGFQEMCAHLEDNPDTRVVSSMRDRLGRGPASFDNGMEILRELDAIFEDSSGPYSMTPPSPDEALIQGMLNLMTEHARATACLKMYEGKLRARAEGKHLGGKIPFGFTSIDGSGRLVPNPEEISLGRNILAELDSGLSIRKVAVKVNCPKHIVESVRSRKAVFQ